MKQVILFLLACLLAPIASAAEDTKQDPIRVCSDLLALSPREQALFLDGYIFGRAMDMKYFQANVIYKERRDMLNAPVQGGFGDKRSRVLWELGWSVVEYVDENYTLVNIAHAHKQAFHDALVADCNLSHNKGYWLFDVIPTTLRNMRETGKYPVHGM